MMQTIAKFGLLLCVTLLAAVGSASAQLSDNGGPIQIDGNVTEILNKENKVRFTDGVDVLQGDARLRADEMTISFSDGSGQVGTLSSAFGEILRIEANGEVFYVTPDQKARGDRAVYTAETETIVLSVNVLLTVGTAVSRTDCVTIDQKNDTTSLGCERGATTVVITPESGTESTAGTDQDVE